MREHVHGGLGGAEYRDAGRGQQCTRGNDAGLAHPAGNHRLGAALGRLDHHTRHLFGRCHGLWRKHDKHAVDTTVRKAGRDRRAITIATRIADEINGISVRPVGRQRTAQGFKRRGRQVRQRQPQIAGMVHRHHARSASVGDDHQTITRRLQMHAQSLCRSDQLSYGSHPDHPRATNSGIEDIIHADDRPGVRHRSPRPCRMAADLHQDHRLDTGRRAKTAHEAARIVYSFDIKKDMRGAPVCGKVINDLAEINVRGTAERNHAGKTYAVGQGPVEHRGADCAGLRHQCQRTG